MVCQCGLPVILINNNYNKNTTLMGVLLIEEDLYVFEQGI